MDVVINYTMEDAKNLTKTLDDQAVILEAEGFDQENNVKLKEAIADLEAKENAQIKSVNNTDKKSTAQVKVVIRVHSTIKRLREAARGAFLGDKKTLKKFKVDEPIPKGIGSLCAMCEALLPIVEEQKAVLLKNGFLQADIDELAAASAKVESAGSERKRNLKLQKSATMVRNSSTEEVKKLIKKIRKFTKARFAERPEILVLFEPVSKGRGAGSAADEKPVEETKK